MKKNIFLLIAFILIGAGIYFSFPSSPSGQGKLETSHLKYDFGQVMMDAGNVEHKFVLENTSNQPITITEVTTSCMCTTAFLEKEKESIGPFGMSGHNVKKIANLTINPQEKVNLKVVFDPKAHGPAGAGYIERSIYVKTNSLEQPQIIFNISGTVNL